mgnify:CR=1 FL=1
MLSISCYKHGALTQLFHHEHALLAFCSRQDIILNYNTFLKRKDKDNGNLFRTSTTYNKLGVKYLSSGIFTPKSAESHDWLSSHRRADLEKVEFLKTLLLQTQKGIEKVESSILIRGRYFVVNDLCVCVCVFF